MKTYIAGKMTGLADLGFSLFDEAAARWRAAGHEVISPAEMDRDEGWGPDNPPTKEDYRYIFANDFYQLCFCDAIALLPNWRESRGARVELHVAQLLRLKVFDANTMERLEELEHPAEVVCPAS